jgi:hypothetical protein
MPQSPHGDRVVSASRAAEAVDWARSLLLSAGLASAAASATIDATPSAVQVLEDLRAASLARTKAIAAATEDARDRAEAYKLRADAAADGVKRVAENVDDGAIADAEALASVAAALQIPIAAAAGAEEDGVEGVYAAALTRVAAEAARAAASAACREANVAAAGVRLRRAAKELSSACEARDSAAELLRQAEDSGSRNLKRAELMEAKAEQYGETAREAVEEMRASGITADRTHDAIEEMSREVEEAEENCRRLDEQLAVFHGLPAVRGRSVSGSLS